ncbi:HNH endonuclease signature motif containing protein [Nocardioides campestrisoli]|uniref:HNH endonuclease signature motif containing protein n=1 Tax=Nocardioides campestrisoli TaxID=2736757 RepID=UPI0015E69B54|nr:HNH endonuclease signature motif containing protein [Nocardioides campestrisoli]
MVTPSAPASMLSPERVDELDAAGVLAESVRVLKERRAAEVAELRLAGHWAVLNSTDPRTDPTASPAERLVPFGGEGTPWVRDLCPGELALVRQVGWATARAAIADVLDRQHRLPRVWAVVEALEAEVWVARKVAVLSRSLARRDVGVVDAAVARAIAGEAPSRVLELARAKVIEADPEAHAHRVALERGRRHVTLSRTDEVGLRHVIARVEAGDAVYVDATVHRVAEILRARLHEARVPVHEQPTDDVLRSEAFGWLARPAELLRLLLEHAEQDDEPVDTSRTTAFPADLLAALRTIDPSRLRPRARLYLHVTATGLADADRAVARLEEHGPLLVAQLRGLLRHAQVELKPVVNLAEDVRVTAYEHPESMRERVWLRAGGERFPWSGTSSRHVDLDHVRPWSRGGPPGQTGTHNSHPLLRRHHRWKTHTRSQVWQVGRARWLWRSPHGRYVLVGPAGTTPVETPDPRLVW